MRLVRFLVLGTVASFVLVSFLAAGASGGGRAAAVIPAFTPAQLSAQAGANWISEQGNIQSHRARLTDLLQDWHLFVEEWTAFRDGAGWFARTTGATYDKALDSRKRADAWDELIRRRGASTAPVGTTPAPAPPGDLIGSVVKLAGLGIAAYVGVSLIQTFSHRERRNDA